LLNKSLLLLAVDNVRWINQDTGIIQARAYLLRDKVRDNGREKELSVNIAELCSVEKCTEQFDETFGVGTLHVGKIRDIGLDVVADHGHHASIKRLPHRLDNLAEAERLAGLLARQSRIFLEKKK